MCKHCAETIPVYPKNHPALFDIVPYVNKEKYFLIQNDGKRFAVLDNAYSPSTICSCLYDVGLNPMDFQFMHSEHIKKEELVLQHYVIIIPVANQLPDKSHTDTSACKRPSRYIGRIY